MAVSTDRQHHRHRQRTCLPEMGSPCPQKCPGAHFRFPKRRKWPWSPFCFLNVPQMEENTVKNEEAHFWKKRCIFAKCTVSQIRSNFLYNHVSNNMHVWSTFWVFYLIFVFSNFHVFFDLQKGSPPMFRNWAPKHPKGPLRLKKSTKGAHSEF